MHLIFDDLELFLIGKNEIKLIRLTDKGKNVEKWTRVFSTRRLDASEKREEKSVSTFGRFCLLTSFESSPVSVEVGVRGRHK